jgi:lipid-binding SYLF domain-containing protein
MKGYQSMKTRTKVKKAEISILCMISALLSVIIPMVGISTTAHAAATAREIDASADAAMDRFYKQIESADKVVQNAKGLLIMPNVKKAGLIVGGEYGKGALRIEGKTAGYYRVVSGSIGFQLGFEAKDIILAFMTDEVLNQFRDSKGWEAGLDGNVAFIAVGGGGSATTRNVNEPIVGYVFDVKGLLGDISLKGAKFSKIDPDQ